MIAIEGVDGAGKRTLTRAFTRRSISQGLSVATLDFPRYGRSVHADLAAESLKGGHGDVVSSAYAMGLLFALDRRDARDELAGLTRSHDLVILDRWVASNAAYGAARLHQDGDGDMARWVHQLEYERFGLPHPDWQVFLDVSPELAQQRARQREQQESDRARDTYERDSDLQQRVSAAYADLAQRDWGGPWVITDGAEPEALAAQLLRRA
ncbi:thymidylate kinase [Mycobacteroides abscessus subsp. bolletii 1S-154-0310]|uniref:Thymidylate kinase n=1 Tax=Mycobacteroides abscessus MAB_091912_2446 TaxID=1335414 RepID=A0A829MK04_9MYCO|nr:thymidylate kinase [Mycobacteroides abscessus subsp. massiliense str. GO 06]EIU63316.1 thymidylate kinase [Mycobacteroides abscessus subsp. bolletii 1S-151-0930]EIU68682.1 thymidylate kinase [Mycobacteroides abscessus subsp. bolletii 1S-152-0914]EIU73895.1 thymidylate kinase [Mycobacteroides abscessus subsp. bolletii 1S-153-0915]EIU77849.1 thymidylate kinase [Mycobacteroides abscessus subsp. bolletii 2B-0626]EIU80006.1 thymidylate kinase [Mycobacteroides abscessus subsp. bolletii 1S-154-031